MVADCVFRTNGMTDHTSMGRRGIRCKNSLMMHRVADPAGGNVSHRSGSGRAAVDAVEERYGGSQIRTLAAHAERVVQGMLIESSSYGLVPWTSVWLHPVGRARLLACGA